MSKILYPYVRHFQRYEYITTKGFVTNKTVADIGCGNLLGTGIFAGEASTIYAIDPKIEDTKKEFGGVVPMFFTCSRKRETQIYLLSILIENFNTPVDVCTAIEVFEHMSDPVKFISKLSELAPYIFLTTPLVKKTGKTKNPDHVAEYSNADFKRIIETKYDILELVYQHADLTIVPTAKPRGCSMDIDHVVQMAWCRRKDV